MNVPTIDEEPPEPATALSRRTRRRLRIVGGVLCFVASALFFTCSRGDDPLLVHVLQSLGLILFGVLLLVMEQAPGWAVWTIAWVTAAALMSGKIHKVSAGQEDWWWLIPQPALLLIFMFASRRDEEGD